MNCLVRMTAFCKNGSRLAVESMRSHTFSRRFLCWLPIAFFLSATSVRAQLVADGETNVLDGVFTTVNDTLTIGTNGSFTLLVLTNGAVLTNSGAAVIGANFGADSNQVVVTGPGSKWNVAADLAVGDEGSFNLLSVSNGGDANTNNGYIAR